MGDLLKMQTGSSPECGLPGSPAGGHRFATLLHVGLATGKVLVLTQGKDHDFLRGSGLCVLQTWVHTPGVNYSLLPEQGVNYSPTP